MVSCSAIPEHVRGYLSRFFSEVSVGLYVGKVTPVVLENLWTRIEETIVEGSFTLIHSSHETEQGFVVKTFGRQSRPVIDIDGLLLATRVPVEADALEAEVEADVDFLESNFA
ncbi:MAG: type I-E CRISPR-associated endoribonuclease Cas2e [Corynebacterium sp.]|uniref:type I-E CRISPR-associated endoribonuclease Cas2e n=1 Tax=Corynebacterium sp. TaxID=1720 RepID=UPI0026DD3406|nr:type I-E CRISPR-associated endoribonuclease Cas2e [Corynebacterium sp.]MDO4762327.1 type I-E CRISPR-associated endoribonuclease Cas2e [Corynebacterium sp.]